MLLSAPRPFAFIPAAPLVAAPALSAGTAAGAGAAATATGVVFPPAAVLIAAVAFGSWELYRILSRLAGADPWGRLNSRPGRPATPPPGVAVWPTGSRDPAGGNVYSWSVTGTLWGPNPDPIPGITRSFSYTAGAGRHAWLYLAPPEKDHHGELSYADGQVHEGPAMGIDGGQGLVGFLRSGGFLSDAVITATVAPVTPGAGQPVPPLGAPFPDGWTPPQVQPSLLPVLPAVKPAVTPGVSPETLPETAPSPVPVAPGVVAPPMVGTGTPVRPAPPIPGTATPTGPDGRPLPKAPPLVTTTPGDVHFPGGIPITSNPPQPTLQGIAQEVGRIENKVNKLLAPGDTDVPDWIGLGWKIWEFLTSSEDQGAYSLHGVCEKDAEGNPIDSTRQFPWGGSFGAVGNVASRVDALAEMLQYSKELKQPICKDRPQIAGEWVSVNFESDHVSPLGDRRLRKVLRYRDQNAHPLEAHVAHWSDFEWQSGPVVVIHKGGVWGVPQVWASTVEEGKRVLSHAAAIAGVDLSAPGSTWVVTRSTSPRIGVPGVMRVRRLRNGAWMISKRLGPDGLPEYVTPRLGP